MDRHRGSAPIRRRGPAEPLELWLIKIASQPAACPECGECIMPGDAEAWHHTSQLYFHLGCAGLSGVVASRVAGMASRVHPGPTAG